MRRSKLTKAEIQECRARLPGLKQMGIPPGCALDLPHRPSPLILEQTDHELARLYQLPWGEVAVLLFAQLTVLTSSVFIAEVWIRTQWDDVLELKDPEECSSYHDLRLVFPEFPLKFLNRWLTNHVPPRVRREEGPIFALGQGSVPPECRDLTPVKLELFLRDQRHDELCFSFQARVDGIVKRRHEQKLLGNVRPNERVSLFEREDRQGEQNELTPAIERWHAGDDEPRQGEQGADKQ